METWETMMPEPCPFCKAKGKAKYIELSEKEEGWYVYCKFCRCQGPPSNTLEQAVLKWNRREA